MTDTTTTQLNREHKIQSGQYHMMVRRFVLSCRVLHLGVEHRMMEFVGEYARQCSTCLGKDVSTIGVCFSPSPRNDPTSLFLQSIRPSGGKFLCLDELMLSSGKQEVVWLQNMRTFISLTGDDNINHSSLFLLLFHPFPEIPIDTRTWNDFFDASIQLTPNETNIPSKRTAIETPVMNLTTAELAQVQVEAEVEAENFVMKKDGEYSHLSLRKQKKMIKKVKQDILKEKGLQRAPPAKPLQSQKKRKVTTVNIEAETVSKYNIPAGSGLSKPTKSGIFLFSRDEHLQGLQLRLELEGSNATLVCSKDDISEPIKNVHAIKSDHYGGDGILIIASSMTCSQQFGRDIVSAVRDEASSRLLAQRPLWFTEVWKQIYEQRTCGNSADPSNDEDDGGNHFQINNPLGNGIEGYDSDSAIRHVDSTVQEQRTLNANASQVPDGNSIISLEEQCRLRRKMRHNLKKLVQKSNKDSYYRYVDL